MGCLTMKLPLLLGAMFSIPTSQLCVGVCVWEEFEQPSSSFTKDAWFQTQPAQKTTMDENKERLRYVLEEYSSKKTPV